MAAKLRSLMRDLDLLGLKGSDKIEVKGIACHSSRVEEGYVFVALRGNRVDGHSFIQEAIDRGAVAIVQEIEPDSDRSGPTRVWVKEGRRALASISSIFYGRPSDDLNLIGITGTNGKTTTSYLIESIFRKAGVSTGLIGTIQYRFCGLTQTPSTTTPESLELQWLLRRMLDHGVSHVIMEVSSHALDLDRVWGCRFNTAVFTNLSRDHLDYHGDMERYFNCKRRLFCDLLKEGGDEGPGTAVINMDDPSASRIAESTPCRVVGYGLRTEADVGVVDASLDIEGIKARIRTHRCILDIESPLLGENNLYNIMAAVAVALKEGIEPEAIQEGIRGLEVVPGRLERVPNDEGLRIFIDYAHTPEALERTLAALRPFAEERLVCIFGCGGDRDRGKRAPMGAAAARMSDFSIVTSDNPRTEPPSVIIREIEEGLCQEGMKRYPMGSAMPTGRGYLVVEDRRKAIDIAVSCLGPKDILLIAGKGHEQYQIIGTEKIPFSDREETLKSLMRRGSSL